MTRRERTLALVLPALIAGCGRGGHHPDPRGVGSDEVLLQVSATGTVDARPTEAVFSVGISSIAPTANAASRANNIGMTALIAAVRAQGVGDGDIQTQRITVGRIDYGPNRGRFEAGNSVSVRVRAIGKAGAAIAAATGAGGNMLSGPDLRVGDPQAAARSAYVAAYREARARAETYAKAADLTVARVLVIRDGVGAQPVDARPYEGDLVMRTVPAPPPVMAGTTTSQVGVSVDFALAKD